MDGSGLEARAGELGLRPDELTAWTPQLTPGVAAASLAVLIRYEDALRELAAASRAAPR